MKTKDIEIEGKTYTISELKYKDAASLSEEEDKGKIAKTMLISATGITEEEYNELSLKEGIAIQKAINEFNGLSQDDFPTPNQPKE